MRTTRTIAALLLALLIGVTAAPPARADVDVSFGFFYSNLEPHGSWLVSAQYGRVWQPEVYAPGWNPYHDGHWEYSDCGWVWVSDYRWGAIPYHYGTWVLDPRVGWVWVPGQTWAPSWVVFRTGPDYIGWAPVRPSFSVGASFYDDDDPNVFVFVGAGDFLSPRIRTHVVPVARTRTVIRNTTIVNRITIDNDIVVNRGPDVRVVERASGKKVRLESIERVRNVAPGGRVFSRADLRVREKGNLRVARPVAKDEPIPDVRRGSAKRDYRREEAPDPRVSARPRPGGASTMDAQRENRMQQQGRAEREGYEQQRVQAERRAQAERRVQAQREAAATEQRRTKQQDKAAAQKRERDNQRADAAAEQKRKQPKKKKGGDKQKTKDDKDKGGKKDR